VLIPQRQRGSIRRDVRAILRLGAPLLVANLSVAAMGLADTVMAGRINADALAAVAVGTSYYTIFMILGLGMMTALSPLAAHAHGAGSMSRVGEFARQGVWLVLVLSVLLIGGLWAGGWVLRAIGTDKSIVPTASSYVHAIAFGMPGFLGYQALRATCEGVGRTRPVMVVAVTALAANVLLNWVFMYGHWGVPALGAVGAGVATAISQWLAGGFLAMHVLRHRVFAPYAIARRPEPPNLRRLREILSLGLPIGGAMLAEGALFSVAGLLIGTLGPTVVAAHQIALNYAAFMFMAPVSLHSATTIHVGHCLGGRDPIGARRAGLVGICLCVLLMIVSAMVLWVGRTTIAALYTDDAAVRDIAASLLALAALFQVSDGLQVGAMGALRGFKDARVPMVITLIAYWMLGFPLAWFMGIYRKLGPAGVWSGLIAGLTAAAVLLLLRYRSISRPVGGAAPAAIR
jgi:multidrug resistance protein, MATE family